MRRITGRLDGRVRRVPSSLPRLGIAAADGIGRANEIVIDALRALNPFAERLSPLDASFVYLERPHEALHVGALSLLDGPVPFAPFVASLAARTGTLRRYRQRAVRPLLDLGMPVWEDAPDYDPRRHIHQARVPAPGGERELRALVDELFARPLDLRRPLWETYLLDGLGNGGAAVLTKIHHCVIDGVSGAELLEVMTDPSPEPGHEPPGPLRATPAPDGVGTGLARRLADAVRAPLAALQQPWEAFAGIRDVLAATSALGALARTPIASLPFNGALSPRRHVVWASFPLDDFLAMRGVASCKVNDVVLAVIAGALRRYLLARGLSPNGECVRALIPVNIRQPSERLTLGNRISNMVAMLPLDVADPRERLTRVADQLRGLKQGGQRRAFDLVLATAGALPPPLVPAALRLTTRWPLVNTVCTNVPGAGRPRFLLGRKVTAIHPIVPLAARIGLGFAILSYDGTLSISANADADLVPDAAAIPEALRASFAELRAALGVEEGPARPATRRRAAPLVGELMTRDVETLAGHDSLAQAWETMRVRRIRHLPVVDLRGRLIGLVTHRDLLGASQSSLAFRRERDRVRLLGVARVCDVMETHVSTARPDEDAAEAGRRMLEHKIGCLPVVGADDRLVGIVTEEDFLRWATMRMRGEPETATAVA